MRHSILRVFLIGISAGGVSGTFGQTRVLRVVAERGMPAPGGTGNFLTFCQTDGVSPFISGRNIAFGAVTDDSAGIYARIDGALVVIADTTTPFPDLDEHFGFALFYGSDPSSSGRNVAFAARSLTEGDSIWASINGELRRVADRNTPVPGGTGTFNNFGTLNGSGPTISGENVAFTAGTDQGDGVYAFINGELRLIADESTPVPGRSEIFNGFGLHGGSSPAISGDNVAFIGSWFAGGSSGSGVYAYIDGELGVIADEDTDLPEGGGQFRNFPGALGAAPSISGENVAFPANGGVQLRSGVYARIDGKLRVIANLDTLVPGGVETFSNFGALSPRIDGENVVFVTLGPNGLYASTDGALEKIADTETLVPGRTVAFGNFGQGAGTVPSISGTNIVFSGVAQGTNGVYALLSEPPPVPGQSHWSVIALTLILLAAGVSVIIARALAPPAQLRL